jgi:PilZ domain-containing protein
VYPEDEHRLTPRQSFEQTVQLERSRFFTGENATVYEIGQVLDISPLGLGIKTESHLQPKEMVRVYLPVQAVDIPLPVFSEVRWVKPHNQHYLAGLQFKR